MKIAARISIVFVALATLLAISSVSAVYLISRSTLTKAIAAHLATTTASRVETVEVYLQMLRASVAQFAQSVVIRDLLRSPPDDPGLAEKHRIVEGRLARTRAANPAVSMFMVLDGSGKVIAASDPSAVGLDRSTDAYFVGARSGVYLKDLYHSRTMNEPLLAVSAPVNDPATGAFLGVLVARVRPNELYKIMIDRTGLGATGESYLVNKYGYMISPSRFTADSFLKVKIDTENYRRALRYHGEGDPGAHPGRPDAVHLYRDYRGRLVLGTHQVIPGLAWTLIVETDCAEASAPLRRVRGVFVFIICAIPLSSWLISRWLSGRITKPIRDLHHGTERIGRGELDFQVGTRADDEIGQLSRAFDKMTESLKTSTTLVNRLNAEIASRTTAEEEVRLAQQKTRAIFDQSFELIGLMKTDGTLIDANRTAVEMAGLQLKDVIGKPFWKTPWWEHSPELQIRLIQAVEDAAAGRLVRFEATHLDRAGALHYIDFSLKPFYDEDGKIVFLIPEGRDVTVERKAAAAARQLAAIVSSTADAIFGYDLQGTVTAWNRSAEELYGYAAADIIGKNVALLVPKAKEGEFRLVMDRIRRGEQVKTFETTRLRRDGAAIDVALTMSSIRDADDRVSGVSVIARDIRLEKELQMRLAASAREWESTFNAIGDLISIQSPDFRILRVNKAYAAEFKLKPEEIIGKSCHELVHHLDHPFPVCPQRRAVELKKPVTEEFLEPRLGIYLEVSASPVFDDNGKMVGVVHIVKDISARKQTELRLAQAMEVKSQFVSMVSHELRTPLAAIEEGIGIVQDGSAGALNKDQQDFLDLAKRNVERLHRLINDVLDYQRLEAGRMIFRMHDADLNDVASEAVRVMQPVAHAKGLALDMRGEQGLPHTICDRDKITQVIINLVNNAIKFTAKGKVTVSTALRGEVIEIRVSDTGPGIKQEDIPKLFRDFSQLEPDGRHKTGSTGLGLAISQKIVREHLGTMRVESTPGVGSDFICTLPVKSRHKIMLVDDEQDILDIYGKALADARYDVVTFTRGLAALEAMARERPDLLILDLRLGDISGYELIGRLRSRQHFSAIPILAMSAYIEELGRLEDRRDDSSLAEISKPFELKSFLELVSTLLRQANT